MKEIHGNLWDYYGGSKVHPRFRLEGWVCITTNGDVNSGGRAVMGRGVALQAKLKYPELPQKPGLKLQLRGNHTCVFLEPGLIALPVRHHWQEQADLELIARSVGELASLAFGTDKVYLPRPGCGNGRLRLG